MPKKTLVTAQGPGRTNWRRAGKFACPISQNPARRHGPPVQVSISDLSAHNREPGQSIQPDYHRTRTTASLRSRIVLPRSDDRRHAIVEHGATANLRTTGDAGVHILPRHGSDRRAMEQPALGGCASAVLESVRARTLSRGGRQHSLALPPFNGKPPRRRPACRWRGGTAQAAIVHDGKAPLYIRH